MPVFISYSKYDREIALKVFEFLKSRRIKVYIDVLDPELKEEEVTKIILKRLEEVSHLLAIISQNTIRSWWVPFEIGVATKGEVRIVSLTTSQISLPDFLLLWPVLKKIEDLEKFVSLYFKDQFSLKKLGKTIELAFAEINTAEEFHSQLKKSLGQI